MKSWYRTSVVNFLLWPISWAYRFVVFVRRLAYKKGLLKVRHFTTPVIVVGNITVGGTGKTPLLIALAQTLTKRGQRVGVVSRGYRGNAKTWPQAVTDESDAAQIGDEPLLIAKKTGVPMVVGPDRVAAVSQLLANHQIDVVLSDDGLQHYALGRDFEIAVVDGQRRYGNGFCLPAGPLREPLARAKTVDAVVCNGGEAQPQEYQMQLKPGLVYSLQNVSQKLDPKKLVGQRVHAVSGIGHPQRFFDALMSEGFQIEPHAFQDHHYFKEQELQFNDGVPVVMTEKDAMRCLQFNTDNFWCLPVEAEFDQALLEHVEKIIQDKRGS